MYSTYMFFVGWTRSPKGSNQADMMLNHAIYNAKIFSEKMAPGYKLIVPIREPVSWFKSAALASSVCMMNIHKQPSSKYFARVHACDSMCVSYGFIFPCFRRLFVQTQSQWRI